MKNVTLQSATVADVERLLPLFRAYQAHYSALTEATEERTRGFLAELLAQPEQGFAILAVHQGEVAGFATGYYTVAGLLAQRLVHLGDLYVAPAFRRNGIATALMDAVKARAREKGIGLVRWLSVAGNAELNKWYGSLGATSGDFKLFLRPTGA